MLKLLSLLVYFVCLSCSSSFAPATLRFRGPSILYADNRVNGEALVTFGDASLLKTAFDSLNENDKYDAVLTGLCSKIIDGKVTSDPNQVAKEATLTQKQLAIEKMKDPLRLIDEMNRRKVKASSRSLMALIDVS